MWINVHTHCKPQQAGEWIVRNAYLHLPKTPPAYALSFGMHPWWIDARYAQNLPLLDRALQHPNCVALGECGLDRLRGPSMALQTEAFAAQLELAAKHQKPVLVHAVRTYSDVLGLRPLRHTPWIIHGFKGSWTEAKKLLDQDIRLSFGARLQHDVNLQAVFAQVPLELLFIETDTRWVALPELYATAAVLRGLSEEAFQKQMMTNFVRDFKGYPNG